MTLYICIASHRLQSPAVHMKVEELLSSSAVVYRELLQSYCQGVSHLSRLELVTLPVSRGPGARTQISGQGRYLDSVDISYLDIVDI